jgi:hypothetical protein
MRPIVGIALQTLLGCGLSVIPICPDATKAPLVAWHPYQHRRPRTDEVQDWISRFGHLDFGLAIVAGPVSEQVEVLDFDDMATADSWTTIVNEVQPGLLDQLVQVQTPRPGLSLWYRCEQIAGNTKLAEGQAADGARKTLIETRGRGGYAIIPPTPPSCHPAHRPYTIRHGTLRAIPTITPDARALLWNTARLFHTGRQLPTQDRHRVQRDRRHGGDRPGDLFCAAVCWHQVLEPHGWSYVNQTGDLQRWRRPGKAHGVSATSGLTDRDLLYVFSQNAGPLEAGRIYNKFEAYAMLASGRDFSRASQALSLMGYRRSRFSATR